MRIKVLLIISFCAVGALPAWAAQTVMTSERAERENTQDTTDVNKEMQDFVQYFRDAKNNYTELQSQEDELEFRRSLLQDDLIPRQGLATGVSQKSTQATSSQNNTTQGSVKGSLYTRSQESRVVKEGQTGVETKKSITGPASSTFWQGSQPLYQGNESTSQNNTQPYSTANVTSANVTVIRAR